MSDWCVVYYRHRGFKAVPLQETGYIVLSRGYFFQGQLHTTKTCRCYYCGQPGHQHTQLKQIMQKETPGRPGKFFKLLVWKFHDNPLGLDFSSYYMKGVVPRASGRHMLQL